MIVEEQGIGFWTRVQIPSAPLFVMRRGPPKVGRVLMTYADAHERSSLRNGVCYYISLGIKEDNINNLLDIYPQLKVLENKELFNSIRIDSGGYGISWNDDLDMDSETIWEDGIEVGRENGLLIFGEE